jgi:Flp pilus assembly protein TadG
LLRRLGRRTDRDAESGVSAIEFVLWTPVLFFLLFATVQFGMYFFARHVAIAAAQEADRVARAEANNSQFDWVADARTKGDAWINTLAPSLLTGSSVAPCQTVGPPWTVSVRVTATVPAIFPGMKMSVSETSTGVVEQFISATGAGSTPPTGAGDPACS